MRDIQADLEEWKQEKNHGVLQLEGSRQIGKTTELLKFAYRNYEYVLYVNFASDEYDFKDVIQNGCRLMEFENTVVVQGCRILKTAVRRFWFWMKFK